MPALKSAMSNRGHVVQELLDTERSYVKSLETLHSLKSTLQQRSLIPESMIRQIFLNIDAIADFQKHFLSLVETTASMPQPEQRWGHLFVGCQDGFDMYQAFIPNCGRATQLASQAFASIRVSEHPAASDLSVLHLSLLRPMSRLAKYPLLLKDLLKESDGQHMRADLEWGIRSLERCMEKINMDTDQALLDEAMEDLVQQVDDWKCYKVDMFGRLLLHGDCVVIRNQSKQSHYKVYLFEHILLCLKEIKSKENRGENNKGSEVPDLGTTDTKMKLKGRLFMADIFEVVTYSRPGSYIVQIFWNSSSVVEKTLLKFQSELLMVKWVARIEAQRKGNEPPVAPTATQCRSSGPESTQAMNIVIAYGQPDKDEKDCKANS